GTAPFARARFHVEREELIPNRFRQVGSRQPLHLDAGRERLAPLALDRLALARRERAEEVVESRVVRILPVELLVVALEETKLAEHAPFALRGEGPVHG